MQNLTLNGIKEPHILSIAYMPFALAFSIFNFVLFFFGLFVVLNVCGESDKTLLNSVVISSSSPNSCPSIWVSAKYWFLKENSILTQYTQSY